jgi:solute carrier family 40 (iron-regulated transporter), member 1
MPEDSDNQYDQMDREECDATTYLLPNPSLESQEANTRSVLVRLYLSHFLSTWSSRMFQFGAVLFLVPIFPGTLLYTSVYALARSLSVTLLASWLGSSIDRLNRLSVLRYSIGMGTKYPLISGTGGAELHIVWQRIPVALSCVCFILLLSHDAPNLVAFLFPAMVILACLEKLASVANRVAVERDWVSYTGLSFVSVPHLIVNLVIDPSKLSPGDRDICKPSDPQTW